MYIQILHYDMVSLLKYLDVPHVLHQIEYKETFTIALGDEYYYVGGSYKFTYALHFTSFHITPQ
jgi:hypothetical protein